MGSNTICNWHTLQSMKQRAADRGAEVVLEDDPELPGWIAARYSDKDKAQTWFLELTDECACG